MRLNRNLFFIIFVYGVLFAFSSFAQETAIEKEIFNLKGEYRVDPHDNGIIVNLRCGFSEIVGVDDALLGRLTQIDNLKEVGFFGCNEITDEGLRVLLTNKKIKTLHLAYNRGVQGSFVETLAQVRQLEWLDWSFPVVPPTFYSDLKKLNFLKKLSLNIMVLPNTRPILENIFVHLKHLSSLRELSLNAIIRDTDIPSFQQMTFLKKLELRTKLSQPFLVSIGNLVQLEELILSGLYTDEELIFLERLKNLKKLDLMGTQMTEKTLQRIEKLVALESLSLSSRSPDLGDEVFAHLKTLPQLVSLNISFPKLTGKGLALLPQRETIQELDLGSTLKDDSILAIIGKMKSLKKLSLDHTQITDKGIAFLEGLDKLEYLFMNETPITDEALRSIGKMKSLRDLYLGSTNITSAGLEHLQNLSALETLYLDDTKVDDTGLPFLTSLTQLKRLDIKKGTSVTSTALQQLQKTFPQLKIF